MKMQKLGGLDVRITGGGDREGGGDGPVVVLLHGYGAPGDDLVGLWRVLDVPHAVRFVFPEAPLSLPEFGPYGARAWWRLDARMLEQAARGEARPDRSGEDPEGLSEAHARVVALLDAVERELGVPGERIVLGGFSQGAMLACDIALAESRPLAGVALLSGTLIAAGRWRARAGARAGTPFFQSHGRRDALLPFEAAERLTALLRDAGCQVDFVPFGGAHEIPSSVLERLSNFLRGCLDLPR